MGSIGIWQLVMIITIVVLLFGTHKLRGLGSDLGAAIKGFRKALTDESSEKTPAQLVNPARVPTQRRDTINQPDETVAHTDHH
ncbi:twin-arginine translocase TatA/TatE family subunit [Aeromonas salmonicida]|uniref:twin-arginine translocase TatA/TatE family subunit n=1 Tax=Aeromonas salmonicida TaxID=645 RepID=UPI0035212EA1